MFVYQLKNKINDKRYIGVTSQGLKQRINQHKSRAKKYGGQSNHFYAALNKYGIESFDISILSECKNKEELEKKEISLIEALKPEYNIAPGGNVGALGHRWSPEQKKKMSEQRKGRKAWNKGIPNTPEQKAKISASLRINNPMFKLENRITLSKSLILKNVNVTHGKRIGQSKYHNLDGSLKERVAS